MINFRFIFGEKKNVGFHKIPSLNCKTNEGIILNKSSVEINFLSYSIGFSYITNSNILAEEEKLGIVSTSDD